jgi:hypothetical protein
MIARVTCLATDLEASVRREQRRRAGCGEPVRRYRQVAWSPALVMRLFSVSTAAGRPFEPGLKHSLAGEPDSA